MRAMGTKGGATVALVLALAVAGCSNQDRPSTVLQDPCALVTDRVLQQLAPGTERVSTANSGDISASKECSVDLESDSSSMRGDLTVTVAVDGTSSYDESWRAERCGGIDAEPSSDGPGDSSCLQVSPWDGSQARVDGWAWVGDDYEAYVVYQLVEPTTLPASAADDLRRVLDEAVASLPPG